MSNETGEIATIRKYLLGDLPDLDAERIEKLYFASGQAVDEVWAAFGEMAEGQLSSALPEGEARRFEQKLRSSPALREMFENEKALRDYAAGITTGDSRQVKQVKDDDPVAGGRRQWRIPATFFKAPRLMVMGVVALIALVAWFGLMAPESSNPAGSQRAKTPEQKDSGGVEQPGVDSQQPPRSERDANAGPTEGKKLAVAQPDQSKSAPRTAIGTTATFLLLASGTRGGESYPILEIPARTETVQLEFEPPTDDCAVFSAVLETESGEELRRWERLRAQRTHYAMRVARLRVPAGSLKNGGYLVRLECVSNVKNPASAAQYRFKLKKNIS
jgi:hypothetical protein